MPTVLKKFKSIDKKFPRNSFFSHENCNWNIVVLHDLYSKVKSMA